MAREAADPEVFAWFSKNYPEVNLLGDYSQILQLGMLPFRFVGNHEPLGPRWNIERDDHRKPAM